MTQRLQLVLALLLAALVGSQLPRLTTALRAVLPDSKQQAATSEAPKANDNLIRLTEAQIQAARITTAEIKPGVIRRRVSIPASITPDPELVGHVAAKVAGTVAELRKKRGDSVAKGEVVAVLDSREVADAKSEYLAAVTNYDLQNTLFQRDKGLYGKQIIAEQLFLKSRAAFTEAKLRLDLSRQKLASLDLSDAEIAALPNQPISALREKEIRSPVAGRVSERLVAIGQPVGGEGQAKEIYIVTDVSTVEADLAVPVSDMPFIKEKQRVTISTPEGREVTGTVVFVNAMLTQETRAGHVIAVFPNQDGALRPGSLLTAHVILGEQKVPAMAPRPAVQMVANESVVFVRNAEGFEKRVVETGTKDDENIQIKAGVKPGGLVAVDNSFVLKAELGKNEIPEE
jgi:cobalt-zinc-cadmium efflux system membrane fusion protein